ncbi:MAG: hypothetical protein JKX97_05305 [Candidatus Lindowbacteria bacterium]|nr:hypothetical protein [Candidatus Lindowbacteria bacterium]
MLSKVPEKMVKHDLVPRVFIDWFENQPMDRGIVMGLKRSMPECRIIGARQYLAIGNWLNCFVTSHEVREGVVPSEYWCMGDDQKELFQRYDKVGVYQTMPATRFKHVFEHDPSDKLGDGLAVLLTYSETESLRIISVVLRALEKGDYGFESIDVRAHPDTDLSRFKKKVKDLFPSKFKTSIRWSENSIEELIVGARMVVTGGSGSAVEALCHGRPVAVVGRQAGLTMNPIEPIDRLMWKEVYSWRELSSFLDEWVTEPPVDDQGRKFYADGVRSRNFECIDFNSCEAILSLLKE